MTGRGIAIGGVRPEPAEVPDSEPARSHIEPAQPVRFFPGTEVDPARFHRLVQACGKATVRLNGADITNVCVALLEGSDGWVDLLVDQRLPVPRRTYGRVEIVLDDPQRMPPWAEM